MVKKFNFISIFLLFFILFISLFLMQMALFTDSDVLINIYYDEFLESYVLYVNSNIDIKYALLDGDSLDIYIYSTKKLDDFTLSSKDFVKNTNIHLIYLSENDYKDVEENENVLLIGGIPIDIFLDDEDLGEEDKDVLVGVDSSFKIDVVVFKNEYDIERILNNILSSDIRKEDLRDYISKMGWDFVYCMADYMNIYYSNMSIDTIINILVDRIFDMKN